MAPPSFRLKRLSSLVRPGVLLTFAKPFRFAIELMSDDFPTFERPTMATSATVGGSVPALSAEVTNSICRGEAMSPFCRDT